MKIKKSYWFIFGVVLASAPASGRMPYYLPWKSPTLREEMSKTDFVLYGTIQNPRRCDDGVARTDFTVSKILKGDPKVVQEKQIHVINKFLSVADPKNPPKFIMFAELHEGKLDFWKGIPADVATFDYLKGLMKLDAKDRPAILKH